MRRFLVLFLSGNPSSAIKVLLDTWPSDRSPPSKQPHRLCYWFKELDRACETGQLWWFICATFRGVY